MLKRIGAEESGEFKAVASGTLPSGKPVVVNADGTVAVVASTGGAPSAGTPVVFRDSDTGYVASAYDTTNNKVVIAYTRTSTGYAVVGTVSGTSISFGSEAAFESGNSDFHQMAFDPDTGKVVIAYHDQSNNDYGTAVVGTVSGTSISFGTPVVFNSAYTIYTSVVYDTNADKIVIAYRDVGNSNAGTAIVGTVSGTSISFGSEATFESGETNYISAAFDSTNNKVVIAYQDTDDSSKGKAVVGTVSSTSISFGSIVEFESGNTQQIATAYDSNAGKVVIAYLDNGNSDYGTAIVGTVSGTGISFGTAVVFLEAEPARIGMTYDSDAQKVVLVYNDAGNSNAGTVVAGTVSGTSISFSAPVVFDGGIAHLHGAIVYDPDQQKVVTSYQDASNGSKGTSAVITTSGPNLTSENYIGMLSGVVTGEAGSTGTAVSFESGTTTLSHVAFDSSNNKVVIAYQDASNSDKGKAIVGTVSGTSISFGSITNFEEGRAANIDCVFDSSNNKIVIVYQDNGDSGRGKGIVGTVSGTSISFGSPTQFNAGANNAYNVSAAFDSSNNKVVIAYRDNGNSDYGTAVVGTVSGTSISFGTPVVFESANSQQTSVTFDSSNNKVVIGYKDEGNSSHGTAIVGTVSGTSISFGSAVVFNAGETSQLVGTFDSSNNKVVLAYRDNGNSSQGTAIVGTVSGTSISFGSEVIFNAANTQGTSAVFDTNANKVVISYEDRGDSDKGKFIVGTVSGTSISFDTETGFSGSNAVFQTGAAFDSNANKVVIAYANDTDSSDRGEAIVTNIDSISRGEVADGGNASIDIIGSVSDNQVSLTAGQQYFVQTDGTIGETADSPSVLAGTAISATELLVKT